MTEIVLVTIIKGLFQFFSALTPAVVIFYLGKKYFDRDKMRKDYIVAMEDIGTLLMIEALHIREHKETTGKSKKLQIRKAVEIETGQVLSGKHSNARIARKKAELKKFEPPQPTLSRR